MENDKMFDYCDVCWVILPTKSTRTAHFASKVHQNNLNFMESTKSISPTLKKYYCELCCKETNTDDQLRLHMNSPGHKDKQATKDFIYLKLDITSPTPSDTSAHLASPPKKVSLIESFQHIFVEPCEPIHKSFSTVDFVDEQQSIGTMHKSFTFSGSNKENTDWCHTCYLKYTSTAHREAHLNGKVHAKRVKNFNYVNTSAGNLQLFCRICNIQCQDTVQIGVHLNSDEHKKVCKQYDLYCKELSIEIPLNETPKTILGVSKQSQNNSPMSVASSYHTPLGSVKAMNPLIVSPALSTSSSQNSPIKSFTKAGLLKSAVSPPAIEMDEAVVPKCGLKKSSTFPGQIQRSPTTTGVRRDVKSLVDDTVEIESTPNTNFKNLTSLGVFEARELDECLKEFENILCCVEYTNKIADEQLQIEIDRTPLLKTKWNGILCKFNQIDLDLDKRLNKIPQSPMSSIQSTPASSPTSISRT